MKDKDKKIDDTTEEIVESTEEAVTLEDVYEPYLMQIGFLSRTPRGRCTTRLAYEHLGLNYRPQTVIRPNDQINLFEITF